MPGWLLAISVEQKSLLWLIPAGIALTLWLARRSLSGLSRGRWWAAVVARSLVILLLVLAAAGAQRDRRHDDLTVVYLLDLSRSVPQPVREDAWKFIRDTSKKARINDRVGVLSFDGQSYIEQLPQKPGPDGGLHIDKPSPPFEPDRTDVAQAVRMALAMMPQDTTKRIVLLTDGNETEGDAAAEVRTAVANGVAVDVAPLRYEHRNEVMFDKLQAPAYAHLHDQASLRLLLRSERETSGTILLYHDGKPVDLDPKSPGLGQHVLLKPGVNALTLPLGLHHAGAHRFEARFQPDNPADDEVSANNLATAFTNVEGAATVLYLRHAEDDKHVLGDDEPLIAALQKENVDVTVMQPAEADLDPISLQQYSAVVLANVPADEFSESQHKALASYVRDLGGGLVMLGGDDSFGAGGWQGSVVEAVMPVRFDVDEIKQIPRGALVIVMHSCEMPQGNYWGTQVCIAALKTLSRLDYFGIVDWGFSMSGYSWEVPLQLAEDKKGIERRINTMQNSDMPDFEVPMDMAYKALAARTNAAQKHVIVISDGDPQSPTRGLLNRYRGQKITVSTVSIFPHWGGLGTLQDIAKQTGGKYYDLSRPGDEKRLPQIFIKEAKVVRRPLLREERFVPRLRSSMSEMLDGVGREFPPLSGYVVTTPRSPGEIEMPLVSDKGDPLLAHWQCGMGKAAAFTSGWWTHWGSSWPEWPRFSKLWVQTIHWCMAQGNAANFEVLTKVEGDKGTLVIEALNKDTAYLNFLQMRGVVVDPHGDSRRVELQQTGPGRYEAQFPVTSPGAYLANVQASGGSEKPALIRTGVSMPYSPEYRQLKANEPLLKRLAGESPKGRLLELDPEQADIFSHDLPQVYSHQPIWNELLRLAVMLFLIDVAVRRVAIDPRAVARRVRAFISDLAGRFAPGRSAEAVLVDLKAAREKVRAEKTAAGTAVSPPSKAGDGGVIPPDRARRFEAGPDAAAKPTADLREAMGGANAAEHSAPGSAPTKPSGPPKPQESTTSRLLKAKKRARSETDDSQGSSP